MFRAARQYRMSPVLLRSRNQEKITAGSGFLTRILTGITTTFVHTFSQDIQDSLKSYGKTTLPYSSRQISRCYVQLTKVWKSKPVSASKNCRQRGFNGIIVTIGRMINAKIRR